MYNLHSKDYAVFTSDYFIRM